MSANHKDADLWIQVWDKVDEHKEQDLGFRVVWVKAHTSAKEKAKMTQQNGQIAVANDEANELAKGGATLDVSEKLEHVAKLWIRFASNYICCN